MGMNRRDRLRVSVASSQHTADLLFALSSSHVDDEMRIVAMKVGLSSAHICVPRYGAHAQHLRQYREGFISRGPMAWNSFIRDPATSTDCCGPLLKTCLFARY